MSGETLLILGSGRWQVPLFQKARELGLRIVATDVHSDLARAPGFQYADETFLIDVRDVERNLERAVASRVNAVVTGVDLAVPTVAAIAARLGLPGISTEAAQYCTDKAAMRRKAAECGLAGPRFTEVSTCEETFTLARDWGYPVLVKPQDNCGSRGVTVVESEAQLAEAYSEAMRHSFSKQALIEEFMRGTECSVEGFVDSDGRLQILGICDKVKSDLPYRYDLELHYPARFEAWQLLAIEDYVARLISGFGITMGFTHTELMISEDKACPVRLIETAARGCGANVIGRLMPETTGVDVMAAYIRQALGDHVTLPPVGRRSGLLKFILAPVGAVRDVQGVDSARSVPGIIDIAVDCRPGDTITVPRNTEDRHGWLLAVGETDEQVVEASNLALNQIHIVMESRA